MRLKSLLDVLFPTDPDDLFPETVSEDAPMFHPTTGLPMMEGNMLDIQGHPVGWMEEPDLSLFDMPGSLGSGAFGSDDLFDF